MKKEQNNPNFFLAALKKLTQKRGDQTKLTAKTGIRQGMISEIISGKKNGSDDTRRKIAAALGYPGRAYEDFLDIGRAILEGREPDLTIKEHQKQGLGELNLAPDWLAPILKDLYSLDQTGQAAVIAFVKTLLTTKTELGQLTKPTLHAPEDDSTAYLDPLD